MTVISPSPSSDVVLPWRGTEKWRAVDPDHPVFNVGRGQPCSKTSRRWRFLPGTSSSSSALTSNHDGTSTCSFVLVSPPHQPDDGSASWDVGWLQIPCRLEAPAGPEAGEGGSQTATKPSFSQPTSQPFRPRRNWQAPTRAANKPSASENSRFAQLSRAGQGPGVAAYVRPFALPRHGPVERGKLSLLKGQPGRQVVGLSEMCNAPRALLSVGKKAFSFSPWALVLPTCLPQAGTSVGAESLRSS